MSAPTSLKMNHPLFIDPFIRKKHMFGYILHIWLSLIPVVLFEVYYAKLYSLIPVWIPIIIIPLNVLIAYYIAVLAAVLIMKIRIKYLCLRHNPREGIFHRDLKNKDYKYLSLRNFARLFPSYLLASTPFPWFRRILFFKAFDIEMGQGTTTTDFWITPEFVEIGKNVQIGFASTIMSSFIENDKLIIKKIIIEDSANLGVKTTVLPGVKIGRKAIIGGGSYILPFENIESESEVFGGPVKFIKKTDEIEFSDEKLHKLMEKE